MGRLKTLLSVLLLALAALIWGAPAAAASSRQSAVLTVDWLFAKGDVPDAQQIKFDDSKWTKVSLPHTFNSAEEGDGTYYRGPAWYRRAIQLNALNPNRRMVLQFDGAASVAEVFVNGRRIGSHLGPHARFRFDITDALVTGRNMLAIRVDNSRSRVVGPLGGDFNIFGGLYRQVALIETDSVHVDLSDHGGPGVYAKASDISPSSARVSIDARISNQGRSPAQVQVVSKIVDAEGREVARAAQSVAVPVGTVRVAKLQTRLPSPRLWDGVRDPYLYRIVTSIGDGGDEVTVPLGVRTFKVDPQQGFILNGKPYTLLGTNLQHSARPGKGNAVSDAEIAEDMAILRNMGSTGVRFAHFQHPPKAYEEADRLGLGVWTEVGVVGEVEDTPEFKANATRQLRELIAQNYNHPSVVMWGMGNEVYSEDPSVARILQGLHATTKEMDPSRPTVYAHCCQSDDHPKAQVTDIIGFNRYFGWYKDQSGRTMDSWAREYHAAHPNRAFSVSEYGAGASIFHQADPPGEVETTAAWHPEQYQTEYHERNWLDMADKPYIHAKFVWVAFDFASAGRHEGDRRGINDKGLVTYDRRTPKDSYYWYKANWNDEPMVYITSRRLVARSQADVEVKAYTNAGPATLVLNGTPVSTIAPERRILRWRVNLRPGPNTIEVRSASAPGLSDSVAWRFEAPPSMIAVGTR